MNTMDYEELEFDAFSLRQELIQRLGRESIGNRIAELLSESPLLHLVEGKAEEASRLAGMLTECIRDGEGMIASQGKVVK